MTKKERKIQKARRLKAKEKRDKGKKTQVSYTKLHINGEMRDQKDEKLTKAKRGKDTPKQTKNWWSIGNGKRERWRPKQRKGLRLKEIQVKKLKKKRIKRETVRMKQKW